MKNPSKPKGPHAAKADPSAIKKQLGLRAFRGKVDWQGDLNAWRTDPETPLIEMSYEVMEQIARRIRARRGS